MSSRLPVVILGAFAGASVVCVALAIPASAQSDDGCTQATPCPLVVTVDATGFLEAGFDATAGDWFVLTVQNDDQVAHTVTISRFAVSVNAAADSEATSSAFQASAAGSFAMTDSPSGDQVTFEVLSEDVVAASEIAASNRASQGKGTPGFELAFVVAALGFAAVLSRRA